MATQTTNLAHPYANALFEIAKLNNAIDIWLNILNNMGQITKNETFLNIIANPKYNTTNVVNFYCEILDSISTIPNNLKKSIQNFLILLLAYNRIEILPEIYVLFKNLVEKTNNISHAVIKSAFAINNTNKQQFEDILSKKFNCKINSTIEIDNSLIGGVKIFINILR